jgi:hypothetical protein
VGGIERSNSLIAGLGRRLANEDVANQRQFLPIGWADDEDYFRLGEAINLINLGKKSDLGRVCGQWVEAEWFGF